MQVRYASWFALALILAGLLATGLHGWLWLTAERLTLAAITGPLSLITGLLMRARPALTFGGGTLRQMNLLGMALTEHGPAELAIEVSRSGRKSLYVMRPSGRRRRVLASPSLVHDRAEAAALMAAVEETAARSRVTTAPLGALTPA